MSSIEWLLISGVAISFVVLLYFLIRSTREINKLKKDMVKAVVELHKKTLDQEKLLLELGEVQSRFDQDVLHDSVTELPSRSVFDDRLDQVCVQSTRYKLMFGVLFLDIDGFNDINVVLGYDVGDELLKSLAKRLVDSVRQVDSVCRFSGDKFVFILPQVTKAETCAYVAQRLLDVVATPFYIKDQELYVTASIGISIYPVDGADAKMILKNADNALHQAKTLGSNGYQFYREEMQALSQRELVLRSHLKNNSVYKEFSLFYQPQIDTKTKAILCMEALLRWQHPDFGLIAAQDFLRLAENSGKMLLIGDWVLRTVCEQFKKWLALDFHPGKIAVNISWRQLENPHFILKLGQLLQEAKMDPSCLILEISETVLLNKVDLVEKSLSMLKHLGVQTAIDDFGTGHLSLSRLQRFAVNYLKIDSTLVQNIIINQESRAITQMILGLAQNLHLQAVAEGVETKEQKELLQQLGCFVMQGYLFSHPRQADEFTQQVEKMICESA